MNQIIDDSQFVYAVPNDDFKPFLRENWNHVYLEDERILNDDDLLESNYMPKYLMSEMTCEMELYLKHVLGFWYDNETHVMHFRSDNLNTVQALADLVCTEIDLNLPDNVPTIWDWFKLGGDDYTDYCGGFIGTMTDMCRIWIEKHPK